MRTENGFTLIELMVVLLLIAILTGIALTVLTDERAKAMDVEAKQHVGNAYRQIEACKLESRDYRPCATAAELTRMGLNLGTGAGDVELRNVTQDGFTAVGHSGTGAEFRIERLPSGRTRSCDPPGEGGCHAGALW